MFDYQIDLSAPYDISITTEKEKVDDIITFIKTLFNMFTAPIVLPFTLITILSFTISKKRRS